MKTSKNYTKLFLRLGLLICLSLLLNLSIFSQNSCNWTEDPGKEDYENLIDLCQCLADGESNWLLKKHFQSIKMIMEKPDANFTSEWQTMASNVYTWIQGDGQLLSTYVNEDVRPMIMAFTSPTDSKVSYYWLTIPEGWDEANDDYPMYLELHGYGGGANDNPLRLCLRPLQTTKLGGTAPMQDRDGYHLFPWGRGDQFYLGQAETDIWECLDDFDAMFTTDPSRQYMFGYSMGGGGTWKMAHQKASRWAAIGCYSPYLTAGDSPAKQSVANSYTGMPFWTAYGDQETWAKTNSQDMRDMLIALGNEVSWHEVPNTGHQYKGEYQDDMLAFFRAHPKGFQNINFPPVMTAVADQLAQVGDPTQTINLTGIADGNDGTETITITASVTSGSSVNNVTVNYTSGSTGTLSYDPVSAGDATITVSLEDDGGTADGGVDSKEYTFEVSVMSDVNSAPTIDAVADVTMTEDTEEVVTLTGIGDGDSDETQNLTITASSSVPLIIPNPVISYSQGASTATLTFTPVADLNGSATITLTIADDGGNGTNNGDESTVITFDVEVEYENDAPIITGMPVSVNIEGNSTNNTFNFTVDDGDPLQLQTMTVTASSNNPTLISNVSITDVSGVNKRLVITPVSGQHGSAIITITVTDDGSTKSSENSLTYTVLVNVSEATTTIENAVVELNVYPNPANTNLNVSCDEIIQQIEIVSISGRMLYQSNVNDTHVAVNVSNLPKGLCFIKISLINDQLISPILITK